MLKIPEPLKSPPAIASSRTRAGGRFLFWAGIGALAALGQAPWGMWPVSLITLSLLIWQIGHNGRATQTGFAAGFGYFACAMFWIIEPFLVEPEVFGWLAPFALISMAAGGGLFWAVPGWIADRLAPDAHKRGTAFAAGLVLSDWIRGWLFTGLPWALTGHIWIDTPAGQFASVGGSIGLSALTMLAASLPLMFKTSRSSQLYAALPGTVISGLLVGLAMIWGQTRQAAPLPSDQDHLLRLVQPNAQQALKWDIYWSGVFFQRLIDLSATPRADGVVPDAVIWPETAVNFLLEQAPDAPSQIATAVGAPVLLGIQRVENGRYFNSFVQFNQSGPATNVYDKFHLVPFGEYTPWGDSLAKLGVSAFAAQHGNGYTSGDGPQVMQGLADKLPPAQVLICYEAIFPQHILSSGPDRPGWLLQITNDAWFGEASGPWQHLAQARLRAIESGLPMIRVANTGVSAVIDARGGLRQTLPLNVDGYIDAALPGALPATIFGRTGPLPAILFAVICWLWAIFPRRRRSHNSDS